ncbi:fibronectin type III domain-containing protein [Melghiribacillus thermohalophilus]|nr:fibronectin type III domain-containing protein [Melghiribacillus thermohalophilus]
MKVGESVDLEVIAMFSDGLKRDVATEAEYKISDTEALDIKKGTMTGKQASVQPVTVTVRFGELKKEFVLRVVNGHQSEWGEPVPIKASDLFWVEESETFIQAPPHLPEGSTIQVLPAHVSAPGLLPVGERFDIHLAFPNGYDTYTGTYHLTMGVHEEADISKTGIYYFNEQTERWEYVDGWGTAENGRIQIEVPHFSIYGVFTDNDGPSNVSLKEKQKTSNSVTLSFTAYDPSAIKSYVIERNGEKIAEIDGNETEFTDTQLSPDQTYLYTLKAIDLLGNESEETTLRVTTDPVQTASEQNDEGTAKPAGQITDKKESKLPQTATFMYKWIAIGIALIAAGMVMIFIRRRNIQRVEN